MGTWTANYRAAPYFNVLMEILSGLGSKEDTTISQLNIKLTRRICDYLGISTPTLMSSELALERSMYFRFPLRLDGGLEAHQETFAGLGVHVRKGVDSLMHRDMKMPDDAYPVAAAHFETTVSLPIYPALTRAQEARCMDAVSRALSRSD